MITSMRASLIWRELPLCLALSLLAGCANAEPPELLIRAEQITAATDALFYDGRIAVDINGDGSEGGVIHYFYSKLGPASTCDGLDACTPETEAIITFYLELPEGRSQVDFICDAIGLYAEKTNQRRDLFCGPKTRLYWNGREYSEKVAAD